MQAARHEGWYLQFERQYRTMPQAGFSRQASDSSKQAVPATPDSLLKQVAHDSGFIGSRPSAAVHSQRSRGGVVLPPAKEVPGPLVGAPGGP